MFCPQFWQSFCNLRLVGDPKMYLGSTALLPNVQTGYEKFTIPSVTLHVFVYPASFHLPCCQRNHPGCSRSIPGSLLSPGRYKPADLQSTWTPEPQPALHEGFSTIWNFLLWSKMFQIDWVGAAVGVSVTLWGVVDKAESCHQEGT